MVSIRGPVRPFVFQSTGDAHDTSVTLSVTLNPSDKAAGITLTDGNLTASASGGGSNQIIRTTQSFTSGKFYWTFTIQGQAAVGNILLGIANSTVALAGSDYLGNNTNSVGSVDAAFFDYSFLHVAAPGWSVGNTIGFAVDFDTKLLWMENVTTAPGVWNDGTGNPATGTAGFDFGSAHPIPGPYFAAVSLWQSGDSVSFQRVYNTAPVGFTQMGKQLDAVAALVGSSGTGTVGSFANTIIKSLIGISGTGNSITTTTFSPTDKDVSLTLSNGNLTVTATTNADQMVRATTAKSTGKWYYEYTMTTGATSPGPVIGFANATQALGTYIGASTNSFGVYFNPSAPTSALFLINNVTTNLNSAVIANGDIISVAIDIDNSLIWFYVGGSWNGGLLVANPDTGTAGLSFATSTGPFYPAISDYATYTGTINFGATAFTRAVPRGFTAWNGQLTAVLSSLTGNAGTGNVGTMSPSTGGNTTYALTGVQGTSAVGAFVPTAIYQLTGSSGTGAVGTFTISRTTALTGVNGSAGIGSFSFGLSTALTGVNGTSAVGSFVPSNTKSLTGNSGTGSIGSFVPADAISLTGPSGTGSTGSFVPTGTKSLSGVNGSAGIGSFAYTIIKALAGNAGTGALGTLTSNAATSNTTALTGVAGSGAFGTITPSVARAATGVNGSAGIGSLAPIDATPLTSVNGTGALGSFSISRTQTLSGVNGSGAISSPTISIIKNALGVSATGSVGGISITNATATQGVNGTGSLGSMAFAIIKPLSGVNGIGAVGHLTSSETIDGVIVIASFNHIRKDVVFRHQRSVIEPFKYRRQENKLYYTRDSIDSFSHRRSVNAFHYTRGK